MSTLWSVYIYHVVCHYPLNIKKHKTGTERKASKTDKNLTEELWTKLFKLQTTLTDNTKRPN